MKKRALFLDRDGVVNVDHGYVYRRDDFHFIDGIFECVREANLAGFVVIIVTNQAGIGRGYYTEEDFHGLMNWVGAEFSLRGGRIDAVYFCPDHPEFGIGKYQRDSDFRKPRPGMLLQAAADWDIDLRRSILVGDKWSDVDAAVAAGVETVFLLASADDERGDCRSISRLSEVATVVRALAVRDGSIRVVG